MKKIHLSIVIGAPVEKVWNSVVTDAPYREWTSVFNAGSYFKGSWEKGSKMLFLGPDPSTGEEGGMVSEIAECDAYSYISIRHLGMMIKGVEDTTSEQVKKWAPSYENYTFEEKDGGTLFALDMDAPDEYYDYFMEAWPKALEKLKEVSERS